MRPEKKPLDLRERLVGRRSRATGAEEAMKGIRRHFTRCSVAGAVALMPIVGLVLSVVFLERTLSESWLADQAFYFPGFGILAAAVIVYGIGLTVTTFIGRWLWHLVDALLDSLPGVGMLYQTLKQVLGYGEGTDAMFQKVVLIGSPSHEGEEIGLVTEELAGPDGSPRYAVFVPGAPNPGAGRLLLVEPDRVRPIDLPVSEALKTLVSVGKNPIVLEAKSGGRA